jgi:hypothetical protein
LRALPGFQDGPLDRRDAGCVNDIAEPPTKMTALQPTLWNRPHASAIQGDQSHLVRRAVTVQMLDHFGKSLKGWSGGRGSNPRRPAWEYDSKLETKSIAFPGTSFWRMRIPRFHSVLPSRLKRSTNGAHLTAHPHGSTIPVGDRSPPTRRLSSSWRHFTLLVATGISRDRSAAVGRKGCSHQE